MARPRARFLAPSLATLVFVAARFFTHAPEQEGTTAAGLSGEQNRRIVAPIATVEARRAEARAVPETETELLELLRRDRSVAFGTADEEDLAAPRQDFSLEEVGVIVVRTP